jgi:enolase-phosphatase E1
LISDDLDNKNEVIKTTIANVLAQMNADRKIQALKQLQGNMWRSAYASGTIKGHVYDDVVPAFDRWKKRGMNIYIYSSGSVSAQKLLFGYSEKGDLLHVVHFYVYFQVSTVFIIFFFNKSTFQVTLTQQSV